MQVNVDLVFEFQWYKQSFELFSAALPVTSINIPVY